MTISAIKSGTTFRFLNENQTRIAEASYDEKKGYKIIFNNALIGNYKRYFWMAKKLKKLQTKWKLQTETKA